MSESSPRRIVIAGAGHAGGVCAYELRSRGFDGEITLVGAEAHPPYERPPLSKDVLTGLSEDSETYLRPAQWYRDADVRWIRSNPAVALDRERKSLKLANGERLSYDDLVFATGASARVLSIPGGDLSNVFTLRTLADAEAIRRRLSAGRRLVVVGGGLIGLEVAASAVQLGATVKVLEQEMALLRRVVPAEIGRHFAAMHASHGVEMLFGSRLEAMRRLGANPDDGIELNLGNGNKLEADLVLVGVGAAPNVDLAELAGLPVRGAIIVDQFGRSPADESVWAIGDCALFFHPTLGYNLRLETWQNAQSQAVAVARNLLGNRIAYDDLPWGWTDQYDVNLQILGMPDRVDELVWRGSFEARKAVVFQLMRGAIVGAITINQGREIQPLRELISRKASIDKTLLADALTPLRQLTRATA
jgi:3-phenylpropionate/trans-cinnamate dioxygenase ferredoxin reductase subunit